uniref:Uncharacterized protein n=1 Tax=Chrysotila carterae TaxID=13221 RepID=A0A7S4B329_CHRCT
MSETPLELAKSAGHAACEHALAAACEPVSERYTDNPAATRRESHLNIPKLANVPSGGVFLDADGGESSRRERSRLHRLTRGISASFSKPKADRGPPQNAAPSAPTTPRDLRSTSRNSALHLSLSHNASAPTTPRDPIAPPLSTRPATMPLAGAAVLSELSGSPRGELGDEHSGGLT